MRGVTGVTGVTRVTGVMGGEKRRRKKGERVLTTREGQEKDNATKPMDAGRRDEKMLGIKKSRRIFSPQ